MNKMVFRTFSAATFLLSLWVTAGGPTCRDNFTVCTEGGCGVMEYAQNCFVYCRLSDGSEKQVSCGQAGGGNEDSVPTPAGPGGP